MATELQAWLELARQLEADTAKAGRNDRIDRREQLYHVDWRVRRDPALAYVPDITPQTVADKAMERILAQPYTLRCRTDLSEALKMPDNLDLALDAAAQDQQLEQARLGARKRADRAEAQARGLVAMIEAQQGLDLAQLLCFNAVVDGYAGPLRIFYDEAAEAEPGVVPLKVQVLDPRAYFALYDGSAGRGPCKVVYKREATKRALMDEGWAVLGEEGAYRGIDLDATLVIYDCWEKRRVRVTGKTGKKANPHGLSRGAWDLQLWNCIILDGCGRTAFLKAPFRMDARGVFRIPYVCRPVRPRGWSHERYSEHDTRSLLDPLDPNWENRCLLGSYQMQLVARTVNPPKILKVEQDAEVDLLTPGADNAIRPNEAVEIPTTTDARANINTQIANLDSATQRATFSAASYGDAAGTNSALQVGRLQESANETVLFARQALERALGDAYGLLAMYAASDYLKSSSLAVQMGPRGDLERFDPELFSGRELFEVSLPAMSKAEMAQHGANWRALSDPRGDGTKWLSDATTREMSAIIPADAQEEDKVRQELWRTVTLEELKKRLAAEPVKLQTQFAEIVNQAQASAQARRLLLAQAPEPVAGPGVAESPLSEGGAPPNYVHNPTQPQAGVQ